jgi:hypothetical protein
MIKLVAAVFRAELFYRTAIKVQAACYATLYSFITN